MPYKSQLVKMSKNLEALCLVTWGGCFVHCAMTNYINIINFEKGTDQQDVINVDFDFNNCERNVYM